MWFRPTTSPANTTLLPFVRNLISLQVVVCACLTACHYARGLADDGKSPGGGAQGGTVPGNSGTSTPSSGPEKNKGTTTGENAESWELLEAQVLQLFGAKCSRCHGEKLRKAELSLVTPEAILKGSESGPIIVPGKPDESSLYEMVHSKQMPPKGEGTLTEAEIATIHRWISTGAKLTNAKAASPGVTQHDVIPLMYLRCTVCHGLRRREANLDLRTRESMLKGGKSGPAIVPGNPADSLLLQRIHSGAMPPRREVVAVSIKPMEPQEIELLTRWIRAGAPEATALESANPPGGAAVSEEDRQFWSFQAPRRIAPPVVRNLEQIRNPLDAFILAKLEAKGLSLSPTADRITLIRRLWFDLLGLPPTPAEVEQICNDQSETWYENMVERLLASPHYGERWGRYWLDLAGYSDSQGIQDADIIRTEAYRYRDYVIRSLNRDKPYDQFLLEQIAGDELVDYENAPVVTEDIADHLIATGFLRMTPDGTHANITNFVPDRLEIVAQEIEVLTSATLGLTLKCARCHSHKFDPIPHEDYYRLLAVFKGAMDEHDWMNPETERFLHQVSTAERVAWDAHEKSLSTEISTAKTQLEKKRQELSAQLISDRLAKLPEEVQAQLRPLLSLTEDKQNADQKALFAKYKQEISVSEEELKKLSSDYAAAAEQAARQVKAAESRRQPQPRIRALWDRGTPSPTYVLKRGNYLTPGRLVEPGPLTVLNGVDLPFKIEPVSHRTQKTGRRLAFARWLTQPNHPLTARVMVNRIWEHHFGTGLVETTDNFGKTGAAPSHPELLDWLATEFVQQRWSLKAMHRLMVNSSTYRQISSADSSATGQSPALADKERQDPDNRLLSRMPVRRLEAEPLYDSLIAVAGRLNTIPFGPSDPVDLRNDGLVTTRSSDGFWRRSVYVLQRRTTIPTLLENFDLPGMSPNCVQRRLSNVAPQALQMLNNGFVNDLAGHFANRVLRESGDDPEKQLDVAYRLALGRTPDSEEHRAAAEGLRQLTERWQRENGGNSHVVEATTHLWIRESAPDAVYEDDLVSVWSSKSGDRARRYGLLEFDVSQFKEISLHSAYLELGVINETRLNQSASLILPEIKNLSWSAFQRTKAASAIPLQQLGRLDLTVKPGMVGQYAKSRSTNEVDLSELTRRLKQEGKLAFLLVAEEDGTAYQQDWDDGVHPSSRRKPPRLVLKDTQADLVAARKYALKNLCRVLLNSAGFLYVD